MAPSKINVLLSTFPGLGLPSTLSVPFERDATVSELTSALNERLPEVNYRLLITTNQNKLLRPESTTPLSTFLSSPDDAFLSLRLSAPLCGGKGGFGSQLRAAGGRMASRKKRNQGETNGSNRNLDGRRLRTVTEAKALAEYLAVKPEMDKKEKEERRRRWEAVVEMTEKKEEEIKNGNKGRLDGAWVEAKQDVENKTREAVLAALKAGEIQDTLGRESDESPDGSGGSEEDDEIEAEGPAEKKPAQQRTFFGWDEDEDMSDEEEEDAAEEAADLKSSTSKGKGKARS